MRSHEDENELTTEQWRWIATWYKIADSIKMKSVRQIYFLCDTSEISRKTAKKLDCHRLTRIWSPWRVCELICCLTFLLNPFLPRPCQLLYNNLCFPHVLPRLLACLLLNRQLSFQLRFFILKQINLAQKLVLLIFEFCFLLQNENIGALKFILKQLKTELKNAWRYSQYPRGNPSLPCGRPKKS